MPGLGYRAIYIFGGLIMEKTASKGKKKYGPNLSEISAVTVRRLAWAMGANMGQAVDVLVMALPAFINAEKVCELCRDKTKCAVCACKSNGEMPKKALALLYSGGTV
jgi:hypothetical protein